MGQILLTGGCGFIGSAFARMLLRETNDDIIAFDKLGVCTSLESLKSIENHTRFFFERGNQINQTTVDNLFQKYEPNLVVNFAAEIDEARSFLMPKTFFQNNGYSTIVLLEAIRTYCQVHRPKDFLLIHVSTDAVYGNISSGKAYEYHELNPTTPYAASKASSETVVQGYTKGFGIPSIIVRISDVYGPFQHESCFVPRLIRQAVHARPMEILGDGTHIRDWIHVRDVTRSLLKIWRRAKPGTVINIGNGEEVMTIDLVQAICDVLDDTMPRNLGHRDLVSFAPDRRSHDQRRCIDIDYLRNKLGYKHEVDFMSGISSVVDFYVNRELDKNGLHCA